jgi:hypothetical protein
MDYRIVFPTFPRPPDEYGPRYFQDLSRSLDALVVAIRTPGEGRQTTVVLTNLQSNDVGLEAGTIFEVNGVLRVSKADQPYIEGTSSTGYVGTVTVTT